jgi:hypothetical protein
MLLRSTTLALLFTSVACSGQPSTDESSESGKADSLECAGATLDSVGNCHGQNGQFVSASCCEREFIEQLADVFAAPGAVEMPPTGMEHGANELRVEVSVLENLDTTDGAKGPFMPQVDEMANELADFVAVNGDDGTGLEQVLDLSDVHMEMNYGWQEQSIKEYLLEIADQSARPAVQHLLEEISAHYSRYLHYDLGAEFWAKEVIMVRPFRHEKAMLLKLRYTE